MEIIHRNATSALFRKAEELSQKPREAWKCIYFKLPATEERLAHCLPAFNADVLSHIFARTVGFGYFCENGEVFVLFKGSYHSLNARLSAYLETLYPSRMETPVQTHFSLFDLSRDWSSFYLLCEKRYIGVLAALEEGALLGNQSAVPVSVSAHAVIADHVAGYLK